MADKSRKPPAYRLHKPTGQAVVRIDGKDHHLGKHHSHASREKYHRLIGEWMAAEWDRIGSAPTGRRPAADPTVGEVILAFWRHAQDHYRSPEGIPSEELGNLKAALRPLRKLYEATPAREFGPLALQAVRDEMVRSGIARTSVNSRVNRIRRAFKWAASVEMIPVSIVQSLATVAGLQRGRTAAREAGPIGPVSVEIVEKTLPFLSRPVAGLVRLQLLTGMRPGEACMIRPRDLKELETAWIYESASHKTQHHGESRLIALGPKAVALVREYSSDDPDEFLSRPAAAVAEHHARRSAARTTHVTPSGLAKRKSKPGSNHASRDRRNTYRNAINRACDKAFPHPAPSAIPARRLTAEQKRELLDWREAHRWHPNQLRDSLATEVRARSGLEAARTVLGHSKADTTQIYAERYIGKAWEVMKEIG